MANTTGKKFGGRAPGTPNKRSEVLLDRAREEDADPFMFLIHVMKGNADAIAQKRKFVPDSDEVQPDEEGMVEIKPIIKFEDQVQAARELMPYLYGKRKPVDADGSDRGDPLSGLIEALRG